MTMIHAAFAGCILSLVYAAPKAPNSSITVRGQDIELAGRGLLDLEDTGDIEALLSVLYELCDYYNTCNKSLHVPDHVQGFLGCCNPCDCSDNCFETGNCCRDKVGKPRRTKSGQIVSENGEVCSLVNQIDWTDRTLSYLLVTQCHPDYQGTARDICSKPHGTTLDELTPVYSKQNGLMYSNIHCARCNYQNRSLDPWVTFVNCESYAPIRPLETIDHLLQNGCQYHWLPSGPTTMCYRKAGMSTCERARYPALCDIVPQGYGFVKELELRACIQCGLLPVDACASTPRQQRYEAILTRDIESLVYEDPLDLKETETVCPKGEVFLDFEKKCLRWTCSPSQVTKRNQCIDLYAMVIGLCLDFRLKVTITRDDAVIVDLRELALAELGRQVFSQQPPFVPFKLEVITYSETDYSVTFNIQVVEIWNEHYATVLDRWQQFQKTLRNATTTPRIRIEPDNTGLAFMPQPLEEIGYLSYADNLNTTECQKTVAMSGIQFCEMVMFAPEEYNINGGVVVLRGGREFHPHEYVFRESRDGSRHVQVCLDTYLSENIMMDSRSNVCANKMSELISLVLTHFLLYFRL